MRQGQAGEQIVGTPGDVLTLQVDGTVAPEPLPAPPAGGLSVILTAEAVPGWLPLVTSLAVDDTYTPIANFVDGLNDKSPFLVSTVDDTLAGGGGAAGEIFGTGGTAQNLYVMCQFAFEVTFSAGVGSCGFTVNLFDDLGTQLTADGGSLVFPITQFVHRQLIAPVVLLDPLRSVVIKVKKNDAGGTVIDGCKLLGFSMVVARNP